MAGVLYTAGYEGRVQNDLLDVLEANGVQVLLDVRAVPMSRKPGFSKRILGASAEARGIRYCHIPALGTPKPGRQAARAGRADEMAAIFNAHMEGHAAQSGLTEATRLATSHATCLLCFERDPHFCHRRIVADMIQSQTGTQITPFVARHAT
jgi:uncharacterized protein (DUF488 family)